MGVSHNSPFNLNVSTQFIPPPHILLPPSSERVAPHTICSYISFLLVFRDRRINSPAVRCCCNLFMYSPVFNYQLACIAVDRAFLKHFVPLYSQLTSDLCLVCHQYWPGFVVSFPFSTLPILLNTPTNHIACCSSFFF